MSLPENARSNPHPFLWVLVGILTLFFFLQQYTLTKGKWDVFDPSLLDCGKWIRFYEQTLYRDIPYDDSHFNFIWTYVPVLGLLLPLYALFRSPDFFIFFHCTVFAASIPLLFLISHIYFRSVLLKFCFPILFILNPMMNLFSLSILKAENLFIPLFFLGFWLWKKKFYCLTLLVSALACLTKVEAVAVLLLAGFLLWSRKRRLGRSLVFLGLANLVIVAGAFLLVYTFTEVQPRWSQFHIGQARFPLSAYVTSVREQLLLLAQWFFLPALAPEILLLGAANFVYTVLSTPSFKAIPEVNSLMVFNNQMVPLIHTEYTFLLPIYFLSFMVGSRRLLVGLDRVFTTKELKREHLEACFGVVLLIAGYGIHYHYSTPEIGPIPYTPYFDARYYCPSERSDVAWDAIRRLPKREPGILDMVLYEQGGFARGARKLSSKTEFCKKDQYAFFDLLGYSADLPPEIYLQKAKEALLSGHFRVALFQDGLLLLTKGQPDEDSGRVLHYIVENRARLLQRRRFLPGCRIPILVGNKLSASPKEIKDAPSGPNVFLRILQTISPCGGDLSHLPCVR